MECCFFLIVAFYFNVQEKESMRKKVREKNEQNLTKITLSILTLSCLSSRFSLAVVVI